MNPSRISGGVLGQPRPLDVEDRFDKAAPSIRWNEMGFPLGRLFIALSERGLCAVEFEKMGRPKSRRPAGQARAHNPAPIVIPCHRVIASDSTLGGYHGGAGLSAKRWLSRLEGATL